MSEAPKWTTCQIVCWALAGLAGLAVLLGTTGSLGFIVALMLGAALAVLLGLVFTRLVCSGETSALEATAGTTVGKMVGTQPVGSGTDGDAAGKDQPASKPAEAKEAAATAPASEKDETDAPTAARTDKDAGEGTRPETLSAPKGGKADNLKEIKGVGPKLEALLHEMGVYHFDQIASWGPDEVAWVDENLKGFKGRVSRDNWVEQARTLAAGGETEFSKRVEDGDVY